MAMIRKQLYIAPEHQRKLDRLTERWHCTEAEAVRRAIEHVPDAEMTEDERVVERLREAGVLVEPPDDPDLIMTDEELEELEREHEEWLASLPEPLSLTEAVWEERDER